jgi:hypothetical protein
VPCRRGHPATKKDHPTPVAVLVWCARNGPDAKEDERLDVVIMETARRMNCRCPLGSVRQIAESEPVRRTAERGGYARP